jgi:DNA-binding NarL/FixJ family response regulator
MAELIKLVVADDHPIVRQGLRRIVSENADMTVIAEAASGDEVLEALENTNPDVLLLDISMPGPPFLELLRHVREKWPRLGVLVLSAHSEDQYAVRALKAGAGGYLTKERSPDELADAVRRIFRGGRYITSSVAEKLALALDSTREGAPHESLSDREYRVLCMLGAGQSVKQIAAFLSLSSKTVSTYRTRLLKKLDLNTTAELIRYVVEHDLQ